MAQFAVNKKDVFRVVAVGLLVLCAGFTFPERNYSIDKTFVKAPTHQAQISSILRDDIEDANDLSTEIHFFQNPSPILVWFSVKEASSAIAISAVPPKTCREVFLRHRQLLI